MKTKTSKALSNFKLEYEELESKNMNKTTRKVSDKMVASKRSAPVLSSKTSVIKRKLGERKRINVKQFVVSKSSAVKTAFMGVVNRTKRPRKSVRKATKIEQEHAKRQRNRGILGIGLLLVVVSIAYSTSVIYIGVDTSASRLALLPQVVFALLTLFKAFSKLYK